MTTENKSQNRGILGKLKDAVWVSEIKTEIQYSVPSQQNEQSEQFAASDVNVEAPQNLIDSNVNMIMELLNNDPNLSGLNKFLMTLSNLESVISDETTRYKAALAATGISKSDILTQIEQYQPACLQAASDLDAVLEPLSEQYKQLLDQQALLIDKIAALKAEMDAAATTLDKLTSKSVNICSEIAVRTEAMAKAHDVVKANRETLAKKIEIFLG